MPHDRGVTLNLHTYLNAYASVLRDLDAASIARTTDMIVGAWTATRTVFLCGNGGSAASAGHLAADLTKLTAPPAGRRLRAVALTDSLSAISAIANDLAYEEIFAEQLRALGQRGDVVIGLSTSGASPNVLRAIEYANSIGALTIGITGSGGGRLGYLARHALIIGSTDVQHVEDATMVAGHLVCLQVRDALADLHQQTLGLACDLSAESPVGHADSAALPG
jgi:D-sedoheptulose 7-phosphate isomerase